MTTTNPLPSSTAAAPAAPGNQHKQGKTPTGARYRCCAATALQYLLMLLSLTLALMPWATASGKPVLVEFVQQYRTTSSIGMLARPQSDADVITLLPAGTLLTSIARTTDGRWLQFKSGNARRTGFLPSAKLTRVTSNENADPLASVIGNASGRAGLDLTDLARSGLIEQRHQQNAMERREAQLRAEQARLEQEQRRMEQERAERARQEEEQRRYEADMAAYDSEQSSSGANWALIKGTIEAIGQAQRDTMLRNHQIAQEARRARDQQVQAGLEAQRQQLEQARQRQLATQQQQLAQRQVEEQRHRETALRQREAQQRQQAQAAQRLTRSLASGSTTPSATTPGATGTTLRQKIYEPVPETVTGTNDTWFGDREMAIFYARLGAVNDINAICRNNQARSDAPATEQIRGGNAPPRWNFSAPDCRQGGWDGKEWKCNTAVSGTCYRIK